MAFNLEKITAVVEADAGNYQEMRKVIAIVYAHLAVQAAGDKQHQVALAALDRAVYFAQPEQAQALAPK